MEPSKDLAAAPEGALTLMSNDDLTYWLFKPSKPFEGPRPCMLFLHGGGGVNDPSNVRGQSLTRMLDSPDYASKIPHVIIMPIAPKRDWPQHGEKVLSLLDQIISSLNLDSSKITLTGQSMGGKGTWDLASRYPSRWSSIVPICGYINRDVTLRNDVTSLEDFNVSELSTKKIWVFHGADDSIVSVENSDVAVENLKAAGAGENVKFTRYAEGLSPPCKTKVKDLIGHGCYELAYAEEELWTWIESCW
ncbi:hypothetical protein TrLO_g5033 [Triparma laevis f. longispina]|uniref:Phospholipase/carboxylesterase/thioesterase domain-containing protein n=1 Tax=Triparma laevis f. longispina TaxID=1714387 RepID=A0A9W6ZGY9_9STRA|nr:hypothetical protein TrLO_g5033 [Triparma laevis f. longispina]